MKILQVLLTAIFVIMLLPAAPVYAISNPDSTPTADIHCYRNLLETGDFLVYIYANIPYASLPDEDVTEAFVWRWMDTDNTTMLATTTGYSYNDSGYGDNIFAMYLSASDAPTWGQSYPIRLSGNPAVFADPPDYNFIINSSDYSSETTPSEVQEELANRILVDAASLDIAWSLSAAASLLTEIEVGTRLSVYGEAFFRGAIYGVQALAPNAFRWVVEQIEFTDRTWSPAYAANISSQWAGTWVATAQTAGADMFSAGYDITSIIWLLILGVLVIIANIYLSGNIWSAMIDVAFVMIAMARLGLYEMSFLALVAAVSWLYASAKTWGKVA